MVQRASTQDKLTDAVADGRLDDWVIDGIPDCKVRVLKFCRMGMRLNWGLTGRVELQVVYSLGLNAKVDVLEATQQCG